MSVGYENGVKTMPKLPCSGIRPMNPFAALTPYLAAVIAIGFLYAGNAGAAYTCNRYVDSTLGNDINDGRSPTRAWASVDRAAAHNRESGIAGDVICFKRGQKHFVVNGQLGRSGTALAPMVFGAYGNTANSRPYLSTAFRIDTDDWQYLGNGVFRWPHTSAKWTVSGVWLNGKWKRSATDDSLQNGDWYYDPATGIYLKLGSGNPDQYEINFATKFSVFGIHGLAYLTFQDLAFSYTGYAIAGRAAVGGIGKAIHHITVSNCTFEHLTAGISTLSQSVNSVAYENHDITISDSRFDDIRYAIKMDADRNGPEHHYRIRFERNVMLNMGIDGAYTVTSKSDDIEGVRMQNPKDVVVSRNDIRYGLKRSAGLVNVDGERLGTSAIVLWRHANSSMERVTVAQNRIHSVSAGIIIGSAQQDNMRNILVENNIVTGSETGLKLNGMDSSLSYHARFNTLFANKVNMHLASSGGLVVLNNLSANPGTCHMQITGANGASDVNYNAYVPDGRFRFENTAQPELSKTFTSLAAFQQQGEYDQLSFTESTAGFVAPSPLASADFRLLKTTPLLNQGYTVSGVVVDFGNRRRPIGPRMEPGAWEADL